MPLANGDARRLAAGALVDRRRREEEEPDLERGEGEHHHGYEDHLRAVQALAASLVLDALATHAPEPGYVLPDRQLAARRPVVGDAKKPEHLGEPDSPDQHHHRHECN